MSSCTDYRVGKTRHTCRLHALVDALPRGRPFARVERIRRYRVQLHRVFLFGVVIVRVRLLAVRLAVVPSESRDVTREGREPLSDDRGKVSTNVGNILKGRSRG